MPSTVGWGFRKALEADGLSVIAEIKRRSPSRGQLRPDAEVAAVARSYQSGGAACISVLTDAPRFGGSPEDLHRAREAVSLPILRKDFLSEFEDMHNSSLMGADAVLVIVADVPAARLRPLQELALTLGLDVVTEVRTPAELEIALDNDAYIIAVNQRDDPKTAQFTVDYNKAVAMSRYFDQIDGGVIKIAASGIGVDGGTSLNEVADAGYDAALIGEALITADDPRAALDALLLHSAATAANGSVDAVG